MAKIGSRILETRLRKGLTLDRVADETNISVRFLSKIENDDFTGFPGEPYVVGFIRNYADYLGLEPEEIVALYRRKDEDLPLSPRENDAEKGASLLEPSVAESPRESDVPPAETAAPKEGEAAARLVKPKRTRKKTVPGQSEPNPARSETAAPKAAATKAAATDTAAAKPAKRQEKPTDIPAPAPGRRIGFPLSSMRAGLAGVFAIIIVGAAILWIFAGGKTSSANPGPQAKQPVEYRVEGGPFEKRLYVGDSLLLPLGDDVYKIRLASITDSVNLETPFGPFKLSLGEAGSIDPDKNGSADASLIVGDFEKNREASGALLRIEFAAPDAAAQVQGEVTIPGGVAAAQSPASSADTVILRSSRGPYPFVVQVSFRGNCLFRHEADKKEWVEKYYSKGESITINVSSALTVWASNAQAAKLSFQATGGKTADLEIGSPGEIAVKKIGWSKAEGGWVLISSNLD